MFQPLATLPSNKPWTKTRNVLFDLIKTGAFGKYKKMINERVMSGTVAFKAGTPEEEVVKVFNKFVEKAIQTGYNREGLHFQNLAVRVGSILQERYSQDTWHLRLEAVMLFN